MQVRSSFTALGVALVASSIAAAASPQLTQLVPQGGQRGTEVVVSLRGPRLGQDPQEILWHEPGIEVKQIESVDDNRAKALLVVPESLPTGRYAMRLRTTTGISNVMTFHVGNLPEVDEAEPNNSALEPQAIDFGSVVNGTVKSEDVDYFSFMAKQGDTIAVEVEGLRLGRTFFDPVVILYDTDGEELTSCDDWPLVRQDACFTLIAPYDGKYTLELRESTIVATTRPPIACISAISLARWRSIRLAAASAKP